MCREGGRVIATQGPVDGDSFLGGGQRVLVPAQIAELHAKARQRPGEAHSLGGRIVGGDSAVEGDGFLRGAQRLRCRPRRLCRKPRLMSIPARTGW